MLLPQHLIPPPELEVTAQEKYQPAATRPVVSAPPIGTGVFVGVDVAVAVAPIGVFVAVAVAPTGVLVAVEVATTEVLVAVAVTVGHPHPTGVEDPLSYQALTIEHVGLASHAA